MLFLLSERQPVRKLQQLVADLGLEELERVLEPFFDQRQRASGLAPPSLEHLEQRYQASLPHFQLRLARVAVGRAEVKAWGEAEEMMPALANPALDAHLLKDPVASRRWHHAQPWVQGAVEVGVDFVQVHARVEQRVLFGPIDRLAQKLDADHQLSRTLRASVVVVRAVFDGEPALDRGVELGGLQDFLPRMHCGSDQLLLVLDARHAHCVLSAPPHLHAHRPFLVRPRLPRHRGVEAHGGLV
mmetsp:Transcript_4922/g.11529  ORF Transcript_4922/g.11529 Transcript_4922/m.11529 type:complete len:243 (-) Transcript_4922:1470-2198(-)